MKHKVPVQSLIDHIKTATDVDPWAKEMAEELLKEQKRKKGSEDSIVRCKDCKWFEMPRHGERGFCKNVELIRETTFYCADGERRESE